MAAYNHSTVQQHIGGNSLINALPSNVLDFVKAKGGHTAISKVLIANNGIAAVKGIRSIRKWSYETFGNEREVEFTVMATPEDLKVNADYIRMADRCIEVPGGSNNNNYANVDLIVDVAERAEVHAVWAGWGHASEFPRLPMSLATSKGKIVFIGPPSGAMTSLGDKISSTIIAQSAAVPTMPWSGSGISDTVLSDGGYVTVPDKAYQDACVASLEEGLRVAEQIGWPVMIKASEGGGGKGIRRVEHPEAFKNAYNAVLGEIPGSPIFIMKLADAVRHLEVQLLADQYGNTISLFGRDCSIQRRHQKIVEEAPVTVAKADTLEKMERAAVRLAKLVGYVSAGTVEYLYSPAEDQFYFLELNPRLQVEHPTTEMVSGVNLPAAQLQIAMGLPLNRIADIRRLYCVAPDSASEIVFDMTESDPKQLQQKPSPQGTVIAVRITAENPDDGFKPSSGSLQELNFRSNINVWGYFSIGAAGGLHEFADSQFGHIFAYGRDRVESRKNMIVALKELSIRGDFRTTVEYLIKLLELDAFKNDTFTTSWLDSLISTRTISEHLDATVAVICGAVTTARLAFDACWTEYKSLLDKGQVPGNQVLKTAFKAEFIHENVRYSFTATRSSSTTWNLCMNGGRILVDARPLADGGLLVFLGGKTRTVYWHEEVCALRLMVDSKTCLIEQENDPTELRSPSPGKLVRYFVESGHHINVGEQFAELEVMKMYLPLVAANDGVVQLVKQPGVSIDAGDILATLTLDDPAQVKRAKPFEGLPALVTQETVESKPNQRFAHGLGVLQNILEGFDNQAIMTSTLMQLIDSLHDLELPYFQLNDILSSLIGRLPATLERNIRSAIGAAKSRGAVHEFPAVEISEILEHHAQHNVPPQDRAMFRSSLSAIYDLSKRFMGGLQGHETEIIANLLERYESTEKLFEGSIEARVLVLRDQYRDDLDTVASFFFSHINAQSKTKLVLALLDYVKTSGLDVANTKSRLNAVLRSLAALKATSSALVSLKAREVLLLDQVSSHDVIDTAELELSRLSNYKLTPSSAQLKLIHIYHAVSKEDHRDNRFFVRALVPIGRPSKGMFQISEMDLFFTRILEALEIASAQHRTADCNHVFMNFSSSLTFTYDEVLAVLSGFIDRYGDWLSKLHVTETEMRISLEHEEGNVTPIRFIFESVSGFVVNFYGYREISADDGTTILDAMDKKGPLHLQPAHQAYPTRDPLQYKRYQAHLIGTTYVYDVPQLFSKALHDIWAKALTIDSSLTIPTTLLEYKELVQVENDEYIEVDRAPGQNTSGMVGWLFTLRTPEYPLGRRAVVVANDITFKVGSFGPLEDEVFFRITQYARHLGIPRIYVSANSGGRIELAQEIMPLFSVAWNDEKHPEMGMNYLYLSHDKFLKLQETRPGAVRTVEIEHQGERRHKITDITGLEAGLLSGAGLIAGEASRAYDDIFTISLVTGRSIGIGAYLVRLGHRSVQVEGAPMILTGAQAINKVLRRDVYMSNEQLGGTQVMFRNGVSHLTARSDLHAATKILEWISYIPEFRDAPLPIFQGTDTWDREIGYTPPKSAYDPRLLIEGKWDDTSGEWLSGFFDKGSFQETLSGWAQTVVVGRARLGGIPMGVIAAENRTIERIMPADPANPASVEQRTMEAGKVWYPNSASKTAQAIFDFNKEGLPLIIFANWRGFSGGQQDLHDGILKEGSKIVDGLSSYKQPVFVYIVPNGELRGGAWAVLGPSINSEQMEMYADVEARAGVLEPEGIVEIKMRRDKLQAIMERLDSTYASLKRDTKDPSKTTEDRVFAATLLERRESLLLPTYKDLAILYADLNDRAGSLEAEGCAKPAVWTHARKHFYWAVRARVARSSAMALLAKADPRATFDDRSRLLNSLTNIEPTTPYPVAAEKLEKLELTDTILKVKADYHVRCLTELTRDHQESSLDKILRLADDLSEDDLQSLIGVLQKCHSLTKRVSRLH